MKLFARTSSRKSGSPVTRRDPDFPVLGGLQYLDFLRQYHEIRQPSCYLEIGTQSGRSLSLARGSCIAVDPDFRLAGEIVANKQALYLYQGTSDDFFASGYLSRIGAEIDLAFLDGMHLFEFLLRDLMNTERFMKETGVIALHDCVPYARIMTSRDWDKSVTRSWTGDVWKLLPILRTYRPDLTVEVLDCEPTGLVLVHGARPGSAVLEEAYADIVAEYADLSIERYGIDRFAEDLALVSAGDYLARGIAG